MTKRFSVLICILIAALLFPHSSAGFPDLVGHWKFDETTGGIAADGSGNNFAGIVEQGAFWVPDGMVDGALYFDGREDAVRIPYRPAFNVAGGLSIAAWVRQELNNDGWILVRNTIDDAQRYYGLYSAGADEEIAFHCHGAGAAGSIVWTEISIDDSAWHHVALVVEYPIVRLYIDGQAMPEQIMEEPIVEGESGDIKIGRRDPGAGYFKGRLDDVRLYGGSLSSEEVLSFVEYSEGEGTAENPYLIYTAAHMQTIGLKPRDWDKHFRLMADIDIERYDGRDGRPDFKIIGYSSRPFSGTFDGNGHAISNFTRCRRGDYIGIFGYVEGDAAVICGVTMLDAWVDAESGKYVGALVGSLARGGSMRDCGSEGGDIRGGRSVGGLVGFVQSATVSDCHSNGAVYGTFNSGGLVGTFSDRMEPHAISTSYAEGSVSGEEGAGGLVGYNYHGTVSNCYSTASVAGDAKVGGLVGATYGPIMCCYSSGSVEGHAYRGGLVGLDHMPPNTHVSYWDRQLSGQGWSYGGIGKTTGQMQREGTFVGWGSSGAWRIDEGVSAPTLVWEEKPGEIMAREAYGGGSGSEDDPYLVETAEQLNAIGLNVWDWEKQFKLVADIDLAAYSGENGNPAFNVIANRIKPFSGVFDGDGHTISNFSYHTDDLYQGLFTWVEGEGAAIHDLVLKDVDFSAYNGGALVGYMYYGSVSSCGVLRGVVSGYAMGGLIGLSRMGEITNSYAICDVDGSAGTGGLVSSLWESDVSRCYVVGSVSGVYSRMGGLVGRNEASKISRCFAIGSVTGGYYATGGLVGENGDWGEIESCWSGGSVSGEDDVGGLVGWNNGDVSNCYSKARALANDNVGGLVGSNCDVNFTQGRIMHCYAAGRVEGLENVGGLIGNNNEYDPGLVTASFWDIETSGQAESDGGTGKTSTEMWQENTFTSAGWDFTTPIWIMPEESGSPVLSWEQRYIDGTGTAEDPYLIATAEQLQAVGANPGDWDKHFSLIADIDLSRYTGSDFNIIGTMGNPFTGVFDGGNRMIWNLSYTAYGDENAGLFGVVGEGGRIKGLELRDPIIDAYGAENAGAIIGRCDGTVSECGVAGGSVTGATHCGGVAGLSAGEITACYALNEVACGVRGVTAGGLVGRNEGRIENCYATGTVVCQAAAGGLVGELSNGLITTCYAAGSIGRSTANGGVAARVSQGRIRSSYWDTRSSRVRVMCGYAMIGSGCDNGNGKPTREMMLRRTFAGWDFNDIWTLDEGNDYPRLRWEN